MARAPILISNGGIVDIITNGLDPENRAIVLNNIKDLIKKEKEGDQAITQLKKIRQKGKGGNAPKNYWRLRSDKDKDKYENKFKNYYKINSPWKDVFDDTMDGEEH